MNNNNNKFKRTSTTLSNKFLKNKRRKLSLVQRISNKASKYKSKANTRNSSNNLDYDNNCMSERISFTKLSSNTAFVSPDTPSTTSYDSILSNNDNNTFDQEKMINELSKDNITISTYYSKIQK